MFGLNNLGWGLVILIVVVVVSTTLLGIAVFRMNRWRRHSGWLLLIAVCGLLFYGAERSRNGPSTISPEGVVDIRIGEPISGMLSRSTYQFPYSSPSDSTFHTGDPVTVRVRLGEKILDFPIVGGLDRTVLLVGASYPGRTVDYVQFFDQHRPLTLQAVVDRARALETWLMEAGFHRPPGSDGVGRFIIMEQGAPVTEPPAGDWPTAEAQLRDDERKIAVMELFRLSAQGVTIEARAENWVRQGQLHGFGDSIYEYNFGRQWGLWVQISANTAS